MKLHVLINLFTPPEYLPERGRTHAKTDRHACTCCFLANYSPLVIEADALSGCRFRESVEVMPALG